MSFDSYLYIKSLHIIFVVTWFAGLFYTVRLFIYNVEAGERNEIERSVLRTQFSVMLRRLWYGITWPSAIGTVIFGGILWMKLGATPPWLVTKLVFVLGLLLYHASLQIIFTQQSLGVFCYSSTKLRVWNEVATIFLVSIVFLAVVKQELSALWGIVGLLVFVGILSMALGIYKRRRAVKN